LLKIRAGVEGVAGIHLLRKGLVLVDVRPCLVDGRHADVAGGQIRLWLQSPISAGAEGRPKGVTVTPPTKLTAGTMPDGVGIRLCGD